MVLPARPLRPSRVCLLAVVATAGFAGQSLATPSFAPDDLDDVAAVCFNDPNAVLRWVHDELQPACAPLTGTAPARERHARDRVMDLVDVAPQGDEIEITHTRPDWGTPAVRNLSGMTVIDTLLEPVVEISCQDVLEEAGLDLDVTDLGPAQRGSGDDGGDASGALPDALAEGLQEVLGEASDEGSDWLVRLRLSPTWERRCGADEVWVRADDALGQAGQVLDVTPDGLLLNLHERLLWVPVDDEAQPTFRMTWRSDFRLVSAPDVQSKAGKKKRRRKRRRRKRRRRRR